MRRLGAVLVLAVAAAFLQPDRTPHVNALVEDTYLEQGEALLHRIMPGSFDQENVTLHLPLFGVFRTLLEHADFPAPALNGLVWLAVLLLTALLSFELGGWKAAGLASVLMLGLHAEVDPMYLSLQPFFAAVVLIVGIFLARRAAKPDLRSTVLLSLAFGAAFLCRSPLFFFPLALVILERFYYGKSSPRQAALLLGLPLLFLVPWVALNWALHGEFVLFERGQADCNIISGAVGVVGTVEGDYLSLADEALEPNQTLGWAARTVLKNPGRYLWAVWLRLLWTLSMKPMLFLAAALALWYGRRRPEILVLVALAVYFIGIHITMSIEEGYFIPLWPLLAALGGCGLASLASSVRLPAAAPSPVARRAGELALASVTLLAVLSMMSLESFRRGFSHESEPALTKALAGHPDDAWLHYRRGYERLKRNAAGAVADLAKAVELYGYSNRYALTLFMADASKADTLPPRLRMPEDEAIIGVFRGKGDAVAAVDTTRWRGRIRGPEREAEKGALRSLNASDFNWRSMLGFRLLLDVKPPEEMFRFMKALEPQAPPARLRGPAFAYQEPDYRLQRVQRAQRAGDAAKARRLAEDLHEELPGWSDRHQLATFHLGSGAPETARLILERLAAEHPTLSFLHRDLGVAAFLSGNKSQGATHLARALALDPKDASAHLSMGFIRAEQGDRAGARAHYRKGLESVAADQDDLAGRLKQALAGLSN